MNNIINIVIPLLIIFIGLTLFRRCGKIVANVVIAVGALFMVAYFLNIDMTDIFQTMFEFAKTSISFIFRFFKSIGGLFAIT